jgi:hypothetical protein
VIEGAAMKVNDTGSVLEPADVVTTTWAGPAVWGGVVAVIWVEEFTVKFAAGVPPKLTPVAPVKLVPVMVTTVPPEAGPLEGLTPVTEGGA